MRYNYETMFGLVSATTVAGTAVILCVRVSHKKRTRLKKLRRSVADDIQTWNQLVNMEISEFLRNLEELLYAFQNGDLAMSRERLRVIIITREKSMKAEVDTCKRVLEEQLKIMGGLMAEVRRFIMLNLLQSEHRSLKKLTYFFNELSMQLERVAANPSSLLTEGKDESTLSFEEVRDLFTILLDSTGTKRTLRAEARRLKDELESSWKNLRKSKNSYNHAKADVSEWKEFIEENSDLIAEVLDTTNEWWPES